MPLLRLPAAPLPVGTALRRSPHTVPICCSLSPPLPRNLRTLLFFAHPSCLSAHGSAAVPPRHLGHPPPRAPTLHMALPARGTDAAPLPPARCAAAPGAAFLGFQRSPARGGAITERALLATGWAMRKEQSSR
ncbi:uncharacterized protein LOC116452247 [Corvus moneduloides]|uniref:uncharacterized protein LOC116452247 n=1 Tax=Corvus moneduloides TaxID=1196302 RepID=UPI0013640272|nr:uncharacterized protein LOC116452247 [Corvus moneduloides]